MMKPTAGLRACIYTRASKDPAHRGRATDSQRRACAAECDRQGWHVVETITDTDRSASEWRRREREGWERVLDLIRTRSIGVLVMWESSRGVRTMEGWVELQRELRLSGVLLSYSGSLLDLDLSSDRHRAATDAVESEFEASRTRDRVLRSKADDAVRGWVGGALPYGYRRVYSATSGHLEAQVPDEAQAAVVRWAAKRVLAGGSLNSIARELNARGEPTPKPPRDPSRTRGWTANTVRQVLLGPAIAGLRRHHREGSRRELYSAQWPAIVTKKEWDDLGATLRDPKRLIHRGTEPRHLLSHIAVCGECGVPVRYRSQGTGAYACETCRRVYVSAPPADAVVVQTVLLWLAGQLPALRGAGAPTSATADAQALVEVLDQRLDEAIEQYRKGEISAATLAKIEKGLGADLDAARSAARVPVPNPLLARLDGADDLAAAWGALDLGDQRRLLRGLVEVRLHRAQHRGGRRFDPERVQVSARE